MAIREYFMGVPGGYDERPSELRENLLRPPRVRMIRAFSFIEVLNSGRQCYARRGVVALRVQNVSQDEVRLAGKGGVGIAFAKVTGDLHGLVGILLGLAG